MAISDHAKRRFCNKLLAIQLSFLILSISLLLLLTLFDDFKIKTSISTCYNANAKQSVQLASIESFLAILCRPKRQKKSKTRRQRVRDSGSLVILSRFGQCVHICAVIGECSNSLTLKSNVLPLTLPWLA